MLDLISRTQGQVYCKSIKGDVSKLNIMSVGLGPICIRVANFPSKSPNDNILMAVKRYSAPRGIKDDVWAQLYMYRVGNGISIVQMDLIKHIPSQLTNGGYRTLISYSGQPATSYRCGGSEHMSQDCPHRTAQESKMRLIERSTWAQLIETTTMGKDGKEIAHEGSGTNDTKTTCGDAAPSPTSNGVMVYIFQHRT